MNYLFHQFLNLFQNFDLFFFIFQISTGLSEECELISPNNTKIISKNIFYLTILKFSFGIIFCISFFGAGKSILFRKKQFQE